MCRGVARHITGVVESALLRGDTEDGFQNGRLSSSGEELAAKLELWNMAGAWMCPDETTGVRTRCQDPASDEAMLVTKWLQFR
ncbi:MAG: hypothetical protein ACOC6R_00020 [Chloroflexota bacterium]